MGGGGGITNNLKIRGSACVSRPGSSAMFFFFSLSTFSISLVISFIGMGFFGVHFWSRDFSGH